ncbi:hypothetical protein ENSA5_58940 [Enhygromyxa salina]|uniref:Uncharacterized protein n=1 Tax=Enhygromyxa salina TaxID=215803 RepID=A0A2S9XDV3_9BACT|nr:hypothetical protein [Enhygromyxa salina]PRP91045.1 hypothetical protein ENSA5_58940 [Enhygromyxa salina]
MTATAHPGTERLAADSNPWQIAEDPHLDRQTKLHRLRDLEYFVRQVEVATEEGMPGESTLPSIDEVLAALAQLRPHAEAVETPTKL